MHEGPAAESDVHGHWEPDEPMPARVNGIWGKNTEDGQEARPGTGGTRVPPVPGKARKGSVITYVYH